MPSSDPLREHFAARFTSSQTISRDIVARQAPLDIPADIVGSGDRASFEDASTECYEWLSLIRLGSPRVEAQDSIDPYLSRYQVPGEEGGEVTMCKLSWQGFMSSNWLHELLIEIIVAAPSASWFSLGATCFSRRVSGGADEVALLRPPRAEGKFLMWETKCLE